MATFIPVPGNAISVVPAFGSAPFVNGFSLAVTGNTTLTVGPGTCRALCNDNIIQFPNFTAGYSGPAIVDISTVGANGCFPVSIASLGLSYNTLFPLYAIKSSSGTGLGAANTNAGGTTTNTFSAFVVATGNNFLPAGYDTYQRIGWVPVAEATGYVLPFVQSGQGSEKEYLYQDPVTLLSAGNATTATEVKLSYQAGMVPAGKIQKVNLNVSLTGNAAASYVYLEPYGLTAASAATTQLVTTTASHPLAVNMDMVCGVDGSGNAAITYLVDNSSSACTILLAGFTDSIGNSLT